MRLQLSNIILKFYGDKNKHSAQLQKYATSISTLFLVIFICAGFDRSLGFFEPTQNGMGNN
jgi:hypothetical protein